MPREEEQQRGGQVAQDTVGRAARDVFAHLHHLKDMQRHPVQDRRLMAELGCMAGEAEAAGGVQVAQGTVRRVARDVFEHLHHLDLRFHLARETGALNRVIDRGTRGITFILASMVFNVVPTLFEVTLVAGAGPCSCGQGHTLSCSVCRLCCVAHHLQYSGEPYIRKSCMDVGIPVYELS